MRPRIPFASSNLKVACTAIKSHFSLYFVVWFMSLCGVAWVFVSIFAEIGVVKGYSTDDGGNDNSTDDNADDDMPSSAGLLLFVMLIRYAARASSSRCLI